MPLQVFGNPRTVNIEIPEDLNYSYPLKNVNLHPQSEDHAKLRNLVLRFAQQSYDVMQARHPKWKEIDQKLSVYIDLSEEEKSDKSADERRPVSMVIPTLYATRETHLTYRSGAFLKNPILKYDWEDPRDALGVIMLEKVISRQMMKSKAGLEFYTHWSDDITYGFGALEVGWETERRTVTRAINIAGVEDQVTQEELVFEGNRLYGIDPYNALPDPNVPITKVKDMQFFGFVNRSNYLDLLETERQNPNVFNVRYLENFRRGDSLYYKADETTTGRYDTTELSPNQQAFFASSPLDIIWMYIKLIPARYGLSDFEFPEIWRFGLAADRVVIYAKKVTDSHGRIPIATIASNADGHVTIPTSILEVEYPVQHAIDWLWSSHVMNVRKHLNNMLVVDPSRININDVMDTRYGMVAKLRPRSFGTSIKDAISQLNMTDVTRGNVTDIGHLMFWQQMISGSTTQAMGIQERRGERVSASEARDTRLANLSRYEKTALLIDQQGHSELANLIAQNTIQYMTQDAYVKLVGRSEEILREEYGITEPGLRVSPSALNPNYEVFSSGGTELGGDFSDTWMQLMAMGANNPEVAQRIDFVRVWLHIANITGAKNPQDFLKRPVQTKVMESDKIAEQARQGNFVTPEELGQVA